MLPIKTYKISEEEFELDVNNPNNPSGAFCSVVRGYLSERVGLDFGRTNACLKVFDRPLYGDLKEYVWGTSLPVNVRGHRGLLVDATKIQNLFAHKGIAPRVFGLVLLEYNGLVYPAQLAEYLTDPFDGIYQTALTYKSIVDNSETLGVIPCYEDVRISNSMGGKWIDFQGFSFKEDYKDKMLERYKSAKWSDNLYQSIPQLRVAGFRNTEKRIEDMRLRDIDLKGKSVIDIGCSGGQFCNYARKMGAKRVVGVDVLEVVEAAREVSNYLGYHNVDYLGVDLTQTELTEKYNIVFYLSMYAHIGLPRYVVNMCKETMIFEKNGKLSDDEIYTILDADFEARKVGTASDYDGRSIWHCKKRADRE